MNKQQITNYIASKLQSLIIDPNSNQIVVLELANILKDITCDDDYSYGSNPSSIGSSTGVLSNSAIHGAYDTLTNNNYPSHHGTVVNNGI